MHVFTTGFPLLWLVCACRSSWFGSYFIETDGCSWRKEEEGHWRLRFLLPVEILGILFSEHACLSFLPPPPPPPSFSLPFGLPWVLILSSPHVNQACPQNLLRTLEWPWTSDPAAASLVHKLLCLVFLSAGDETLDVTHAKQAFYLLTALQPQLPPCASSVKTAEYKALLMCSYFKAFGRTSISNVTNWLNFYEISTSSH